MDVMRESIAGPSVDGFGDNEVDVLYIYHGVLMGR